MAKNIIIVLLVIFAFAAVGYGLYESQQVQQYKAQTDQAIKDKQAFEEQQKADEAAKMAAEQQAKAQVKTLTVTLDEENKSGESGTATLKEENGKVTVAIAITGFIKDTVQPAHIHEGVCPGVGKVVYPLNDVINGQSTTTLAVTLDQLKSQLPLALNIHKSKAAIGVYTVCGSLGSPSGTPSAAVTPTSAPTHAAASPSASTSATPAQ